MFVNPSKPNDFLNTFPSDSPAESLPDSALIQTALCYLMTRYALHPCPGLVYTIMHHLQMLLAHPDMVGLPERRQTHGELLQRWKQIDEHWRASCREKVESRRGVTH